MAKRATTPPPTATPAATRAKRPSIVAPPAPQPKRKASKVEVGVERQPSPNEDIPEDLQAIFGENLKTARLECGLKQSDVSERTGLTQQRLSFIEKGSQNLTLKTMMKLARVVDRSVSAMLLQPKARRAKE